MRTRSVVTIIRNALAGLVAAAIGMRMLAAMLTPLIPLLIALLIVSLLAQLMVRNRWLFGRISLLTVA